MAGTSAYAFSLMLATFLFGLSLGAATGSRFKADGALGPVLMMQAALAASVLGGVVIGRSRAELEAARDAVALARSDREYREVRAVELGDRQARGVDPPFRRIETDGEILPRAQR